MCGIKMPQQDFVLKTQGGLMREGGGGCICGTLRYIITIILTNVRNLLISTVNPCTSNLENKHVDIH